MFGTMRVLFRKNRLLFLKVLFFTYSNLSLQNKLNEVSFNTQNEQITR